MLFLPLSAISLQPTKHFRWKREGTTMSPCKDGTRSRPRRTGERRASQKHGKLPRGACEEREGQLWTQAFRTAPGHKQRGSWWPLALLTAPRTPLVAAAPRWGHLSSPSGWRAFSLGDPVAASVSGPNRPKHTFSSTEKGLLDLLTFLRIQLGFINFLYYSPLFSTNFCYFIISFPLFAFHF